MKGIVAANCLLGFVIVWAETTLSQSHCEGNATFIYPEEVVLKLKESRIITSPNYPYTYPQNKRCYWRVRGDSNIRKFVIKVVFLHLQLESSTNCRKDSISFYEGNHRDQDWFLGTFCGTTHPEVLYTRKTNLWPSLGISSITGQVDQYRAFKLEFTLVPEAEADGICRSPNMALANKEPHRLAGSSGTIFTPNYPVNFQSTMTCVWIITVPEGHVVRLRFTDSKLSPEPFDYNLCDVQPYVEIRDGDNNKKSKLLLRTCSNAPSVVQSSAYTSLWIKFDANNGAPNRGFKAHYEAIPFSSDVECVPGNPKNRYLRLAGSNGTLKSPQYTPATLPTLPTTITCIWVITVPDGKVVKLNVYYNFINHNCDDYIEIRDGRHGSSELKGERLCGFSSYKPKDICSSGRYLRVEYVCDRTRVLADDIGFTASFEAVTRPETYIISFSVVGALVLLCSVAYVYYYLKQKKSRQTASNNPVPNPCQPQTTQQERAATELTSQHPPLSHGLNSQTATSTAEIYYPKYSLDITPPDSAQDELPPPYSAVRDPPPPYPGAAQDT